jgi:secreted PhoX family phosphatase
MSQRDSDPTSNPSANRHFSEIIEINRKRRQLLVGGVSLGALGFFRTPALAHMDEVFGRSPAPGFTPISAAFEDTVRVPEGYSAQVLYRWGDPTGIPGNMPPFQRGNGVSLNSAEDQAFQAGQDHDGMHFFPMDDDDKDNHGDHGRRRGRRTRHGLMCINYENIQPEFLLGPNLSPADRVLKMKNSHGLSVIEVRQDSGSRQWRVVRPSKFARRITANTPIRISGPAAGHSMMKTSADPSGRRVLGTLNNCANGFTPWGTYLTCEENFNGYFDTTDPAAVTPHMRRYGVAVPGAPFGYNWSQFDDRFDAAKEPNESNRFGWVVEVDPRNRDRAPVKHTALGRMKHENVALVLADDGRVVVYMGDDERNEYIYKFVSDRRFGSKRHDIDSKRDDDDGEELLDRGKLYVAVFEPGATAGDAQGTGRWVPLEFGKNGLTPENGFTSQAEVLIKTRQAADRVGATMMDRPEWIAVHPRTKEVYITLTNNNRRGTNPPSSNNPDGSTTAGSARPPVDEANPRANNVYGHILRWRERRGDPAALTFSWDVYLFAGDPADPGGVGAAAETNTLGYPGFEDDTYHIFSAPDGLAFDPQGWLWIETDYSPSDTGVQANMGNCHMLLADLPTGRIGRFLSGPNGCEITGWTMTPDRRSLFVNIQHPGEGGATIPSHFSTWPDGVSPPRSAMVVITKDDGGVIGS